MSSQSLSDLSGSKDFLPSETESEFSPGFGSFDSNSQAVSTSPSSTHPLSSSNASNSSISSTVVHRGSPLISPIHAHGTISRSGTNQYWKCSCCRSIWIQTLRVMLILNQVYWSVRWQEEQQSQPVIWKDTILQRFPLECQHLQLSPVW